MVRMQKNRYGMKIIKMNRELYACKKLKGNRIYLSPMTPEAALWFPFQLRGLHFYRR